MPLGRQPRDNYDPLDRTFYYLRPRSDHLRMFFDRSNTKVLLFHALLDRNVSRYPYSIEAHPSDQLFALINAANIADQLLSHRVTGDCAALSQS
jgi:hypothetical protein